MDEATRDRLLVRLEAKVDWLTLQLNRALYLLGEVIITGEAMAADLTHLEAQVKANTDAEQSAVTLLTQLSDLLKASATDPAKVNALADSLKGSADRLAAAILQNTPAQATASAAPAAAGAAQPGQAQPQAPQGQAQPQAGPKP